VSSDIPQNIWDVDLRTETGVEVDDADERAVAEGAEDVDRLGRVVQPAPDRLRDLGRDRRLVERELTLSERFPGMAFVRPECADFEARLHLSLLSWTPGNGGASLDALSWSGALLPRVDGNPALTRPGRNPKAQRRSSRSFYLALDRSG
jgi:hypothetical protein